MQVERFKFHFIYFFKDHDPFVVKLIPDSEIAVKRHQTFPWFAICGRFWELHKGSTDLTLLIEVHQSYGYIAILKPMTLCILLRRKRYRLQNIQQPVLRYAGSGHFHYVSFPH